MVRKKVLISRRFPNTGIHLLERDGFEITQWPHDRPMTDEELIEQAKKHNALMCTVTDKIDNNFLSQCNHLEIISQFAVGFDNIDTTTATQLGIPVGNTPDVLSDATADVAFGLLLTTARKMFFNHKSIINGEWNYFKPDKDLGQEIKNKTLGIFGLGRIGIEMARRCKGAYNMNIIYCNRKSNTTAEKELNAKLVSFDELLEESDVLSVHSILSEETANLFNKQAFNKMKPSSIFINTARGSIHNEQDLLIALKEGTIWGAGLDVTNPEPMSKDHPLLSMPNVSILPHIGSATITARSEMSRLAALNIIEFYKNREVPHCVNREVLRRN